MNYFKTTLLVAALLTTATQVMAAESIYCSEEAIGRTIFVSVQPTDVDGFRAIVSQKLKYSHIPAGEPVQILAEYEHVYHNQHLDLYFTPDHQFALQLGDGSPPHLRAGELELSHLICSRNEN